LEARQKLFTAVGAYENVYGDTDTSVPKSSTDIPERQSEPMESEMVEKESPDK
jgi:hypothetical protein